MTNGSTGVYRNIKVLYHANCDDGFGSAWAAYRFFTAHGKNHLVEYIPVKYNEKPPELRQEDVVYIVDFSYPRPVMEQIKSSVAAVTVLDHHKTAEAALKGLAYCTFDMKRSGAVLTWNHFFDTKPPKLLQYVQDNDLWQHKLKDSKLITRYIRSYPQTFEAWNELHTVFEYKMAEVIVEATGMQRYFEAQLDNVLSDKIHIIEFQGHICPVANLPAMFTSEGCHKMFEQHNAHIAMSWFMDHDMQIIGSLRSDGTVDVGELAKPFGGGGHNAAAGFKMVPQRFFEMLYANNIKE